MIAALLVAAGVGFLIAAGFNVSRAHFNPGWLGLACLAAVAFSPTLFNIPGV